MEKETYVYVHVCIDIPGGSVVKNQPAKQEMWVWSLGWEDPLEKETTALFSILVWKISRTEETGRL